MATLVDSGVWIDYVDGRRTPETDCLDRLFGAEPIVMGDLVLMEVLQGLRSDRRFEDVRTRLALLPLVAIAGGEVAIEAARNYRLLRARGITIRNAIDVLVATRCIVEGWSLLHRDRDCRPFVTHFGLKLAMKAN